MNFDHTNRSLPLALGVESSEKALKIERYIKIKVEKHYKKPMTYAIEEIYERYKNEPANLMYAMYVLGQIATAVIEKDDPVEQMLKDLGIKREL